MTCSQTPEDLENEYLQELEEQWMESQPRFSDAYLIETFGDGIEGISRDKLRELNGQRKKLIKGVKHFIAPYGNRDDMDAFFAKQCIKQFLIKDLIEIEKSIFFIKRLQRKMKPQKKKRKNSITDEDIEKARNASIIHLAENCLDKLKKTGSSYTARCPFHEDKTPSFTLYPDSNRFYCFGCHETGDAITLAQKLFGQDFKTAVKSLTQQ